MTEFSISLSGVCKQWGLGRQRAAIRFKALVTQKVIFELDAE